MAPANEELSVLSGFHIERQPIGLKFSSERPGGLAQLGRKIALCEMLKEAQPSESAFHAPPENQSYKPVPGLPAPHGKSELCHHGFRLRHESEEGSAGPKKESPRRPGMMTMTVTDIRYNPP